MSEANRAEAPEADHARVQPRQATSQPPPRPGQQPGLQVTAPGGVPNVLDLQPQAPRPPDPEKELAKPLDELPVFEEVHVFKLAKPIQKPNGQIVTEIKCRAPTGSDMFEVGGMPTRTFWTQGGMQIEMEPERFRKWLSRIADHDVPTIYRAPARDVRAIYEWLNGELNPAGN